MKALHAVYIVFLASAYQQANQQQLVTRNFKQHIALDKHKQQLAQEFCISFAHWRS